jgi:hypothetical protein
MSKHQSFGNPLQCLDLVKPSSYLYRLSCKVTKPCREGSRILPIFGLQVAKAIRDKSRAWPSTRFSNASTVAFAGQSLSGSKAHGIGQTISSHNRSSRTCSRAWWSAQEEIGYAPIVDISEYYHAQTACNSMLLTRYVHHRRKG